MSVPDEPVCPCGWPEPHPKLGVFSYAKAYVVMNTLASYFLERGYTLTSDGGDSRELSTADGCTIRLVLKRTWDRHCDRQVVDRWIIGHSWVIGQGPEFDEWVVEASSNQIPDWSLPIYATRGDNDPETYGGAFDLIVGLLNLEV